MPDPVSRQLDGLTLRERHRRPGQRLRPGATNVRRLVLISILVCPDPRIRRRARPSFHRQRGS